MKKKKTFDIFYKSVLSIVLFYWLRSTEKAALQLL